MEDYKAACVKYMAEFRKERSRREMAEANLRDTEIKLELAYGQIATLRKSKMKDPNKMQLNSSIKLASTFLIFLFLTACTSFVEKTHTWDDGSTSQVRSSAVTHPIHGGATENRFKNCDVSGACTSKVVTNSNPSMVGTFSEVGASAIDTTNDYADDVSVEGGSAFAGASSRSSSRSYSSSRSKSSVRIKKH